MDVLLWGRDRGVPAEEIAPSVELDPDELRAAYWEIDRRRQATTYLHASAILIEPGEEPG